MRISFIGGGSDFQTFFSKSEIPGRVLGASINKFVYVMASEHPKFEPFKFKFTYRKTEEVHDISDFEHPVVRVALNSVGREMPLNLATMASLPGRSGLGSSSAFTVALLAVLSEKNSFGNTDKEALAIKAVEIERKILNEAGGVQDQFHAAFGGFRLYEFEKHRNSIHQPIDSPDFLELVEESLYLVASGPARNSSQHSSKIENSLNNTQTESHLQILSELALQTYLAILNENSPLVKLEILSKSITESWEIKKKLGVALSLETQKIITAGVSLGAKAFKLCGAGGSGFVAFLVPPRIGIKLVETFGENNVFRPGLSNSGVEVSNF